MSSEPCLRILVIGDSHAGKTSLLNRFSDGVMSRKQPATVGIDYKVVHVNVLNKRIRLQIWDTAGQERFRSITRAFYRKAHGVLIVYDVTNAASFKNVTHWVRDLREKSSPFVNIVLIGNKSDLVTARQVSLAEGEKLASSHNIKLFETSAWINQNVNEAFMALASEVMGRLLKNPEQFVDAEVENSVRIASPTSKAPSDHHQVEDDSGQSMVTSVFTRTRKLITSACSIL